MMEPYYSDELVTIYQGDSCEVLPALNLEAELVLADPPYMDVVDAEWDGQWATPAAFIEWLGGVLDACGSVMADRGSIGVFCSPRMAARVELAVDERFAVFNNIVWRKPTPGRLGACDKSALRSFFPMSERLVLAESRHGYDDDLFNFTQRTRHASAAVAYEPIRKRLVHLRDAAGFNNRKIDELLGTKGMASHYFGGSQWSLPTDKAWAVIAPAFQAAGVQDVPTWVELRAEFDALREAFDDHRRQFDGQQRDFGPAEEVRPDSKTLAYEWELMSDVWTFQALPASPGRHICEKPPGLIRHIIETMTRPGDLVVDPFLGSGVTADVCRELGRRCVGVELDPEWCERSKLRLSQGRLYLV
jgi:site-specific DNA-methyltransferase (adenine-specific)